MPPFFSDALRRQIYVDAFMLYTDNMTWAGSLHPAQALNQYRRAINPKARFIVTAMVPYTGSVADPKDPLAMNVVGFDTDAPGIISAFVRGEI